MGLDCPACHSRQTLQIQLVLELPADSRSDEITLQIVGCSACDFAGLAIYEESRRGALGSEAVEHGVYELAGPELAGLRQLMKACPARRDPHCPCSTHRLLSASDLAGRWAGPASFVSNEALGRWFNLD
jgi:hypothetical protein